MHITFITPYPSSSNQHDRGTGVGSYSMYLINALAKEGHTIDIYAHQDIGLDEEKLKNINVYRVWKKSFGGLFSLFARIIKDRPRVVHIQHEVNIFGNELILPFTPLIAGLVRLYGGRVITTFHGGMGLKEIDKVFIQENGKKLPPWVIRLAFRYVFGLFSIFSHSIIVHEPFQKDQLAGEHGIREDKIIVIPHGVPDTSRLREGGRAYFGLPENKKIFLYMGFAARYKGLPELYESYREYIKEHDDVILLLSMSPAPRLRDDVEYMNWFHELENKFAYLGDSVRYVGFMDIESMEYAYTIADRVLFPYSRRLAASGPMALAIGYEKEIILSNILKGGDTYGFHFEETIQTVSLKKDRTWKKIAKITERIYENDK